MLGSDGIVRPCAVKTVSYSTRLEQDRVCSELTALKAALDEPHLVQCLGVFPTKRPDSKTALVIVTEEALLCKPPHRHIIEALLA